MIMLSDVDRLHLVDRVPRFGTRSAPVRHGTVDDRLRRRWYRDWAPPTDGNMAAAGEPPRGVSG